MGGGATAGDLLGLAAIEPDGLMVAEDGTYVRALEVGTVNPLVLDQSEGERVSQAFAQVVARLPDRQSLQLYVQGTPLALDDVLAEESHRCEQAAELLVSLLGAEIEESLLDRTTRLLHEVPHRTPVIDEAKLMADALNLDDFGLIGLIIQAVQLALQGEGVADLAIAAEKREEYGYWEARIKDGFHFEPVRVIAIKRLATSRRVAKMLADELKEDRL